MFARLTPATRWLAASCMALTAGCATKPDLGVAPEISAPSEYASAQSFAAPVTAWPGDNWWVVYNDPQLTALIDEALADSPSLEAAAARLRQAQAALQKAGAPLVPQISASGSALATRRDLSTGDLPESIGDSIADGWSTRGKAGAQLEYQLDFFGRNRAALAAAASDAKAAEAEAASARLQLSTAVALAYADLLRYCANRDALRETARLRADSAALVHQRERSGLENQGAGHQADSELARARADLAAMDGTIARSRNAIAALLGKGPDRGLEIDEPSTPAVASSGLPASVAVDLVGRRPDLTAARLRAEAAAQRIRVARADFYPNVDLMAMGGIQTISLDSLAGGPLALAQVGPAVTLPIFSGGRLEGAYRGARASYDEAVALYENTLVTALREVADAISDRRALDAELSEARKALTSAEAAYRVARHRYEGGLSSYIDALNIENGFVAQRRAVADLETRGLALDIVLVRALGGGFTAS
ncbi:MAG: efflux transporter outer membrane subunit [Pseudomonadota bacterium]|nr:efflux transporter outer membrane subunit [Pseudomonadota bacterium]